MLSALVAAGLTALPTLLICFIALRVFENYGWILFVGVPLICGFFSAFLYSFYEVRTIRAGMGVACLSILFLGLAIILCALDGFICVLMALPLALGLCCLGSWGGSVYAKSVHSRRVRGLVNLLLLVACPFFMGLEQGAHRGGERFRVDSSVEVNAPPETVWKYIPAMPEITATPAMIFRLGVACPMATKINGTGVGARRQCLLTTGSLDEIVTRWRPNETLRFRVLSTPPPMKELSPYASLKPVHLDEFYKCQEGEFRLIRLPGGRTRVEGSSWYSHEIWPSGYWRQISDYVVHRVHYRVMDHVKALSEADAGRIATEKMSQ